MLDCANGFQASVRFGQHRPDGLEVDARLRGDFGLGDALRLAEGFGSGRRIARTCG